MKSPRFSRVSSKLLFALSIAGLSSVSLAQPADESGQQAWSSVEFARALSQAADGANAAAADAELLNEELRSLQPQLRPDGRPAEKALSVTTLLQQSRALRIYQYLDLLFPSTRIARGSGAASPLGAAAVDLDRVQVADADGKTVSLVDWQRSTVTDGLLVLHRGQVVYERYEAGMNASRRHALWSVTKSLTGVIAADLIQAGTIDASAPVSHYLPELRGSAWEDATVQQTLDMTTGVAYREGVLESDSGIVHYLIAAGLVPAGPGYQGPRTVVDFLKSLKKEGEHGTTFRYKTVETEVIGLLLSRVTGKDLATLISERLWAPIGAEHDAFVLKDRAGTQLAGSGMGSTLRDLARFGEMIRLEGRFNGQQVLQPGTVAEIRKGGDQQAFRAGGRTENGYSYHNFWWVSHDASGSFEAKGLNGQHIHINPAAELVVVKFSSNIIPDPSHTHVPDRNAFVAIAEAVRGR